MNFLEILYAPLMFCAKYVVLRQIQTIFLQHRQQRFSHNGVLFLIWANLLFYLAFMFSFIFACVPREKIWNPPINGQCINIQSTLISSSAINIVSDITILILPLLIIWKLQMPIRSKLKVAPIFAIGLLYVSLFTTFYFLRGKHQLGF